MIIPSLPNGILLFLLGGAFLHFAVAGGRTFYSALPALESAGIIAEVSFVICGAMATWIVGLGMPIHPVNGAFAAVLLVAALWLYEWARHTIRYRRFGVAFGDHVPEALCEAGPYRWVRHPVYASYLLAFCAVAIALPHWVTLISLAGNAALFVYTALNDEKEIAGSALAADYAAYRERTGMFLPRFSRSAPGR